MNKPISTFKFYSAPSFKLYPISLLKVDIAIVFNAMQHFPFVGNFFDRIANNSTNRAHSNSNFSTSHTIARAKPAGNILISASLSYLNFIMLFIVYPSISNPGPKSHIKVPFNDNKSISVFYQNVQGLIPFGCLTDLHPNLNSTKIYELQAYILKNNPDVIILNETWLKPKY